MKLNILYRLNPTGEKLLNYFQKAWERVSYNEFLMDGNTYLDISVYQGKHQIKLFINQIRALMNNVDNGLIEDILSINGIATNLNSSELLNKNYEILIFDRIIISIRQFSYTKSGINKKYIEEIQIPKISEFAKHAAYLLGLDIAMINVSVNRQNKMKISGVDASPDIRDKDLIVLTDMFEKIKQEYQDGWPETEEVKLGADPEFMIANSKNGKMIPASEFFPREGLIGCDNIRVPSRQQRPVAELRPKPDTSPTGLYINIKQALEQANKKVPYKNVKWLAGSQPFNGYSIGGHIHFSNLDLNNRCLRALDNYLGLPVYLLENQDTSIKRRIKYGHLGDIRLKEYGGFEYRTLASWLINPDITMAVLCLAKIVSSNYRQLDRNVFLTVEAQRAFYRGDRHFFRPYIEDIWRDIQRLDIYHQYKLHLEPLENMIDNDMCWDEKADIRKSWSLSKVYNKTYVAKKQVSKTTVTTNNVNNNNHRTTTRRSGRSATNASRSIPIAAVGTGNTASPYVRNNVYQGNYI